MLRVCSIACVLAAGLSSPLLAQATTDGSAPKVVKSAGVVNLNSATVAELESLPGIGARVAARIVEYRTKKGPFKRIEELMNVQGVGEKNFLKLRPQLSVSERVEPSTRGSARYRPLSSRRGL